MPPRGGLDVLIAAPTAHYSINSRSSSGSGRCNNLASDQGAESHAAVSAASVRITGIAFGWIGTTTPLGSQVRKAKRSSVVSPSFSLRRLVQLGTQIPAKKAGWPWVSLNQAFPAPFPERGSAKRSRGTKHRFCGPSQRRQWGRACVAHIGDAPVDASLAVELRRRWQAPARFAQHMGLSLARDDGCDPVGIDLASLDVSGAVL